MKTTFEMNGYIGRMLTACGFEIDRIVNSVQSALAQAKLEKSKTERTDVKLSESKSKGDAVTFNEKTADAFKGEANGPTRFAAWHDAQAGVWKKHGEPSDELDNMSIVPQGCYLWLAKFRPAVTAGESLAQAHREAGNPLAAQAATEGARNGGVGEIKTPEPAGAKK